MNVQTWWTVGTKAAFNPAMKLSKFARNGPKFYIPSPVFELADSISGIHFAGKIK